MLGENDSGGIAGDRAKRVDQRRGISSAAEALTERRDEQVDELFGRAAQMGLQGARVVVTDPQALANAERAWPSLTFAATAQEAAAGADVVVLATEWAEYRALDPVAFGEIVAGRRIVDGRNVLDPVAWRAAGWHYRALGRP